MCHEVSIKCSYNGLESAVLGLEFQTLMRRNVFLLYCPERRAPRGFIVLVTGLCVTNSL